MSDDCAVCRARRGEGGSLLQQRFIDDAIAWPQDSRCAVSLTINYQGAEGLKPGPNGRVSHEQFTEREYGTHVGIWRVLDLLKETAMTATFLVCGSVAEHYPETVLAIHEGGHEIAGHGYHHEVATNMPREDERQVIVSTLTALRDLTGAEITGWRSCSQSPATPELALEQGLQWNSNSFLRDLPYLLTDGPRTIVEIPRQPFGDHRTYESGDKFVGDPDTAFAIWKGSFDAFYSESGRRPTYCPISLHPFITGRPGRTEALARLIDYIQQHQGVWFATSAEVARVVLDTSGITADGMVQSGAVAT